MEEWERLLKELHAEFLLREEELELLHQIDLRILEGQRRLDETFSYIVAGTQALLKSEHTHVLLKRGGYLESVYTSALIDIGQRIPISTSITGSCLISNAVVCVPNLDQSPFREQYHPIHGYEGPPMQSLLAAPIRLHGVTIGVLNAESTLPGAFRTVHERMLPAIAAQVAIALERAQHFDQAELFADVDQLVFADNDPQEVLQSALEKVTRALERLQYVDISGAQILFRRGPNELEIVHSTNPADRGIVVAIDNSICGLAVTQKETIVVGDVTTQRQLYRRILGPAIKSEIAVPIMLGDNNVVIGVLNVESEELDVFSGFYEVVLTSFADKVKTLIAFTKLRADVTEALELRHADELLVAVGDQTSNLIHRLNNTVGAMRVRLRELQGMQEAGELQANDDLREAFDSLLSLADRTLEMPQQVTRFLSRNSDAGDINEYVKSAIADLEIPASIELAVSLSEHIPTITLYCFDIVVQNLLQNALDAMPKGGRLTVTTSTVTHPQTLAGYVQIVVKDTGVGISDEIRPQVFELNFSTKSEKSGKGLGLGLWWVRSFVRRALGEIAIVSTVGIGTKVTVKLPVDSSRSSTATPSAELN